MNILLFSSPYYEYLAASLVDGFHDLGHIVYDLRGQGFNYAEPFNPNAGISIDLFIVSDPNDGPWCRKRYGDIPKVIIFPYDRWINYSQAPRGPVNLPDFSKWSCDIAFIRDWDGVSPGNLSFPVYPIEYGIERRYMDACARYWKPWDARAYDVVFFGTRETAKRNRILTKLEKELNCNFGPQWQFCQPDDYWSRWVNGRFYHCEDYFKALCDARVVLSPFGAGPSCGRTYEAFAAKTIPAVQSYPPEIKQIIPFISGEHCIAWNNVEDAVKKITDYIKDPTLMQKGFTFGQTHLLTKHRSQYILNKLEENKLI